MWPTDYSLPTHAVYQSDAEAVNIYAYSLKYFPLISCLRLDSLQSGCIKMSSEEEEFHRGP